jgi:hypothetical protein
MREQGARDDAYDFFAGLHASGRLLPDGDDRLRDALERNVRIVDAAAGEIRTMLTEAFCVRAAMSLSGSVNSLTLISAYP